MTMIEMFEDLGSIIPEVLLNCLRLNIPDKESSRGISTIYQSAFDLKHHQQR